MLQVDATKILPHDEKGTTELYKILVLKMKKLKYYIYFSLQCINNTLSVI